MQPINKSLCLLGHIPCECLITASVCRSACRSGAEPESNYRHGHVVRNPAFCLGVPTVKTNVATASCVAWFFVSTHIVLNPCRACLQQGKHRQRHNSSAISISPSLDLRSWREFRAVLVSKEQQAKNKAYQLRANASNSPYWCHRLPRIEPGCLILANQAGMGFYEKAVILVCVHQRIRFGDSTAVVSHCQAPV